MTWQHTPGPWVGKMLGDADAYHLLDANGRWLFSFRQNGEIWTPEQLANLVLLENAPALFTALKDAQKALAMVIDPKAIAGSSIIHAFAQCTVAEAQARKAIATVAEVPPA